jgi:hypothetical protein
LGDVAGATVMEISELEVAPALGPDTFALDVPPGFAHRRAGSLPALAFSELESWDVPAFRYGEADSTHAQRLRAECGLDEIAANCASDFERVRALCTWVHGLWEHTSDGRPKKADPLSIVQEARAGGRFRCVEYATVLVGCLNAMQIRSRLVNLLPHDIEISFSGAGHMVVEAFLADAGRWVFADPQYDAVVTVGGVPANAVELQAALAGGGAIDYGPALHGSAADYRAYVGPRLFYFRAWLDMRQEADDRSASQLVLVPLGAPEPRVFERKFPIANCIFTHSLAAFYAPPEDG